MKQNRKAKAEGADLYTVKNVTKWQLTFSDGTVKSFHSKSKNPIAILKIFKDDTNQPFVNDVLLNYKKASTSAELANLCGYDCVRTFTRHFKAHYKETPYQWMLNRKLEEIQTLVINTDMSITQISRRYYFKSVSHLINLYTKRFGISPQKHRETKIKENKKNNYSF